ncbi:MAG TPA: SUMF1/EgtB/PvdO family nonheme iron enzyme [Gemmatimonadales bacterium]|jgi:formylglycine-generating enzyme required for sulfatase activity|nr:SUMF1/EgtB/PvdO family nonheme iron enzyme [Gemmatimonadales bacterium]
MSFLATFLVLVSSAAATQQAADPALAHLKQGNEYFNEAIKLFEAKSWKQGNEARAKGIESYRKAIELNPKLFEAQRNLGDLLRRNAPGATDIQHAVEAYKRALEIKPDAETSSRLGISYGALGKTAEAIPAFEQAVRLDPSVAMYQYNLGFTYVELVNLEAARKVQERLQTMDQALAEKLLDKIRQTSGEASLIGRPKTYSNPKIELVAIPPGSFELGGWTDGQTVPGRKVTIKSGFYLGKYPVTQAQWQAVMGDNPSFFKNCGANCPVEQVSWHDAQAFVTRLNQLHDGFRYRLPSEAEWEYAYRGGTKTITYARGDIGWNSNNSGGKTHPVGEKPANPFGLYDMGGHVKEWCLDWYASPSPATDVSPVVKGDEPMYRLLRGTTFYAMAGSVTTRTKGRIDEVSRNNGFRVVAEKVR